MTGMRIIVKVGLFASDEVWCRAPAPPADSIPEGEVCRVLGYRMSGALAESIPEGEVCRVNGYRFRASAGSRLTLGVTEADEVSADGDA